jgi:hypothetical protein
MFVGSKLYVCFCTRALKCFYFNNIKCVFTYVFLGCVWVCMFSWDMCGCYACLDMHVFLMLFLVFMTGYKQVCLCSNIMISLETLCNYVYVLVNM